jgi:hypothetical protein
LFAIAKKIIAKARKERRSDELRFVTMSRIKESKKRKEKTPKRRRGRRRENREERENPHLQY